MGVLQMVGFSRREPSLAASPWSPSTFAVLDPETLLAPHTHRLIQIRQQVGVPAAHWTTLYERLLLDFAAFVQMLPASEAHHHCEAGGLLRHGLDTTLRALTIRRGVLLPAGAGTEQLAEKQDVWTYATATAALLHDLGKPVVDQAVTLFGADGLPIGRWNPLAGPMSAATYAVEFVRGRRYRLHPRLPPLLVQFIVPPVGLEWISRDLDVFEAWLATISGGDSELAGELGRIVRQADSASVSRNLASSVSVAPATRQGLRPLGERLGIALRHLIDTQSLPLNRPGAAGWVFDEDLWLVSKRVLDALREALVRESGGGGLPRNERLMDELQQSGVIVPNGDRAIWTATIELGGWRQRLTMLRVPLARLWTDPASRPPAVDGRAIPETDTAAEGNPDVLAAMPVQVASTTDEPSRSFAETAEADTGDPMATSVHTDPDPGDIAGGPDPLDDDFLRWISDGVRSGRLKVNTVDARVHVTQEGLLLVSPGIFRDYAGVDGWAAAQKKLQKLKRHLKTPEGTNIWTYRVSGERRSSAQLKGLLFPDAAILFGLRLPEPNPHLALTKPLDHAEATPDRS